LSGLRFLRLETSLGYMCDTFKRYGDVVRYRLGPFPVFLIAHPDGIKHVLQENHTNYVKSLCSSSFLAKGWSRAKERCGCASGV
jgi:hypothetical protein